MSDLDELIKRLRYWSDEHARTDCGAAATRLAQLAEKAWQDAKEIEQLRTQLAFLEQYAGRYSKGWREDFALWRAKNLLEPLVPAATVPLVMADGSSLYEYLRGALPKDAPMDEWTRGYEEHRRRLFAILGPQLQATQPAPLGSQEDGAKAMGPAT